MSEEPWRIRRARPGDGPALVELIQALAEYEKLPHLVKATPQAVESHLFGTRPSAEAIIAETTNGRPIGIAIYFFTFSTFRAQQGIYLEDIFVRPEERGRGVGKALLATVARVAVDRGCGRLEWSVLDWNEPAIKFYQSLGARPMDEWTVYRLDDERLTALGRSVEPLG